MPGQHTLRQIIICPVGAKLTSVVSWLQANVDATTPADLGPPLSATGEEPATHRWQNAARTDPQARAVAFRMCDLAGVAKPTVAAWDAWTKAEKRDWWVTVRNNVFTGFGALVQMAIQDSVWDDPDAVLAAVGLNRINNPPGAV